MCSVLHLNARRRRGHGIPVRRPFCTTPAIADFLQGRSTGSDRLLFGLLSPARVYRERFVSSVCEGGEL